MSRPRTTIDVWHILVNYGQGWEDECEEFTRTALREQKKAYAENCGYPFKVVKRRHKRSEYTPEQLADIERQIAEDRVKERERILARAHRRLGHQETRA